MDRCLANSPLHPSFLSRQQIAQTPPANATPPSDDAIEALIQQATSASRLMSDGRQGPLRDTRTQLFVGNLPYKVRWQDLKDLFRKAGTILRADVSLGPDNRSRGYGTVLLATAEDAGRAVDMFNGYSWQNRVLEVRLDRLLPDFDSVSSGASHTAHLSFSSSSAVDDHDIPLYPTSHDPNLCRNLFVGNLPFHCQWQDLKDLFRQAGTIIRADVVLGVDGRSRGFGTVVFATEIDAERAVKMFNGYEYNGRALKVHFDKFSSLSQPPTTPASPAIASTSTQHPSHITLPAGYLLEYDSGPSSPFEMFTLLQIQQHQQRLSHSPHPHQIQQSRQQQHNVHPRLFGTPTRRDFDNLTHSLAPSRLLGPPRTTPYQGEEALPLSTITSSSSTTTTSSSSGQSAASTSASSVPHTMHAQPFHHLQYHHQQHPYHPGSIALPPPLQVAFTANTQGPPASPLHQPNTGFPLATALNHQPPHHYHHNHPLTSLTPQGLPPITPSMPSFTFLQPGKGTKHESSRPTSTASGDNGSSPGRSETESAAHPSRSASASSSHPPSYIMPSSSIASSGSHRPIFPFPLPSPGLPPASAHADPPMGMHINLGDVHRAFSPGVVMSPGTFYGRAGEVQQNPFINAAVGAPVHPQQQHQQQVPGMYSPGGVHPMTGGRCPSHGSYFYAVSSPHQGPPKGLEPNGYFDPLYFPAMVQAGQGQGEGDAQGESKKTKTNGLVREIMKGPVGRSDDASGASQEIPSVEGGPARNGRPERAPEAPQREVDVQSPHPLSSSTSRVGTDSSDPESSTTPSLTSGYTSSSGGRSQLDVPMSGGTTILRAQSMGDGKHNKQNGKGGPSLLHRAESAPVTAPGGRHGQQQAQVARLTGDIFPRTVPPAVIRRATAWKSPEEVVEAAIVASGGRS